MYTAVGACYTVGVICTATNGAFSTVCSRAFVALIGAITYTWHRPIVIGGKAHPSYIAPSTSFIDTCTAVEVNAAVGTRTFCTVSGGYFVALIGAVSYTGLSSVVEGGKAFAGYIAPSTSCRKLSLRVELDLPPLTHVEHER